MPFPAEFESARIRLLRREEFDEVVDWAASEGWNPGLRDAEAFWATDPEAYLGIEFNGELVASGASVSYDAQLGFMGLFIVRPEFRRRGLGGPFWYHRRDTLRERLAPGAAIGLDGVFGMQHFYAKGGFELTHRNLRMEGRGRENTLDPSIEPLSDLPFDEVADFDRAHFGARREAFLKVWIRPPWGLGLGLREAGGLRGMGVIRPCRSGFKIGPLFAEDAEAAERIFRGLNHVAVGRPVFLDVPEANPAALELAKRHHLREVFGCARMYLGSPPNLPWDRIFGVTTFELG